MITVDRNICPADHLCPLIATCPVGAISQGDDGYPVVDHQLCIECGKCVRKCPKGAMKNIEESKSNVQSKINDKMKIAVPTRENQIDNHFGHCDHYTIFTVEEREIVKTEILPSPQGCGCKSGIAADLQRMGVSVMLAGNMGQGAKNKLEAHGIEVIRGCSGSVQVVVGGYLAGAIRDSGQGCAAHEGGHQCGNHGEGHSHECHH